MVRHYIILSSSYSKGRRIGLDIIGIELSNIDIINHMIDKIKKSCGEDTSLSLHCIEAESKEWESVKKEDSFFEDILLLKDEDEFIQLIQKDRTLSGLDVAKYILSKKSCTQLKLQKLVYYCYAEYLCSFHKRLFEDQIYAFELGPVVESVREKFKGSRDIDNENLDGKVIEKKPSLKMPVRSRILFAEEGNSKLQSIDQTIEKYGEFTASKLVNLTHRAGTPWKSIYDGTSFKCISDELIKEKHHLEVV